jgi:hypothetical protein
MALGRARGESQYAPRFSSPFTYMYFDGWNGLVKMCYTSPRHALTAQIPTALYSKVAWISGVV